MRKSRREKKKRVPKSRFLFQKDNLRLKKAIRLWRLKGFHTGICYNYFIRKYTIDESHYIFGMKRGEVAASYIILNAIINKSLSIEKYNEISESITFRKILQIDNDYSTCRIRNSGKRFSFINGEWTLIDINEKPKEDMADVDYKNINPINSNDIINLLRKHEINY